MNETRSTATPIPLDTGSTHNIYSSQGDTGGMASVNSLLRRQFSQHVRDVEISRGSDTEFHLDHNSIDSSCLGKHSHSALDISDVHSPLSVFHRQHVSVPVGGSSTTWAVKAQQYAVLVTNVDPTSKAIRNPGGHLTAVQAAELEVSRAFESIFPTDSVTVVPVRHHVKVDALLKELDETQISLLRLDDRISMLDLNNLSERAKTLLPKRDTLANQIRRLVAEVQQAKVDSNLCPRSGLSYFVIFRSQVSAAIAAQTLLQEPGGELPWRGRTQDVQSISVFTSALRLFLVTCSMCTCTVTPSGINIFFPSLNDSQLTT